MQQNELKAALNIRTFDEIQRELSTKTSFEGLMKGTSSSRQPDALPFDEPMATLPLCSKASDNQIISTKKVTERQLVVDSLLLFQQVESPTYSVREKTGDFDLRDQVTVEHLSPESL